MGRVYDPELDGTLWAARAAIQHFGGTVKALLVLGVTVPVDDADRVVAALRAEGWAVTKTDGKSGYRDLRAEMEAKG